MEKTREPILLPAILFSIYLLLFPIDSALGELIGTISVNNYIAIVSLALTLVFAMKRIIFKFDNFTIINVIFVVYQFLIIIKGGYFFTNRNIIFLYYFFTYQFQFIRSPLSFARQKYRSELSECQPCFRHGIGYKFNI